MRTSEEIASHHKAVKAALAPSTPRGKSEICEMSGLPRSIVDPAIEYLVANGQVTKHGDKRGAKYTKN